MRLTSSFLREYRSSGPPVQLERVLAVGRAFLTVAGFVAIVLDPTEPTRLREVTYTVLLLYAAYSLAVLVYVHRAVVLTPWHGQVLHGLDIVWTSALTFVSEGPVSPFFLFFLFVLLAAAYRGGLRPTLVTAVVTIAIFLLETAIAANGPWNSTWFATLRFDLNATILRVAYLMLTGVLLGYLAEQEKQSRAELAAIADATRQPRVNLGFGGSVTAVARRLLATFGAASAAVVVYDHETRRTLLWRLERTGGGTDLVRARRTELTTNDHPTWRFQDFGRAWHAVRSTDEGELAVQAVEPGVWPLQPVRGSLPDTFRAAQPFKAVAAVNVGLPAEWDGRFYLFDPSQMEDVERGLHFLEDLSEHVTPALTNVFLLRRLRARAGAAERARVARELHDGAIQALLGIELKLEAVRRATDRSPAFVDREVGEAQALLRREVLAIRELMHALRPVELEGADQLPDVLAGLVERFRRDTAIAARFVAASEGLTLPPAKALEVVRIVQEALVNVRRHSGARHVLVSLTGDGDTFRLAIEDDGCGFGFEGRLSAAELERRHLGPSVIRERARLVGAQLTLESSGAGTRIEIAFTQEMAHG